MMSQTNNLRAIKRNAWRTMTDDGLLEVVLGLSFTFAALIIIVGEVFSFNMFYVGFMGFALVGVNLTAAKQRYTYPRVGRANMVQDDVRQMVNGLMIVSLGLGALTLIALIAGYFAVQSGSGNAFAWVEAGFVHLAAILGIGAGGAFLYAARWTGVMRWATFGIISIAAGPLTSLIDFEPFFVGPTLRWGIYFAVMALALVPVGAVLLSRFLRSNPIAEDDGWIEDNHDA